MDKFERRLNQVNMVTPIGATRIQQSAVKIDPTKSYASLNDFNKQGDQYDSEMVNLRSQVQILEGKLQFYEREFQIKQASLEKRIQQLISTSSQLTQQNTQLRLQYSSLMNEYQQLQEKYQQLEKNHQEYEEKVKQQLDGIGKFQTEKDQLIMYANKCRERSKQRKIKVKDLTNITQELQEQLKTLDQQLTQINDEKEQLYQQLQQQIQIQQEQNEDWEMKYDQLVQNFKNHLENQNENESQLMENHTILDEREAMTVNQQLENYSFLQKDINMILSQMRNGATINPSNYQSQQIVELAEIITRMYEKLFEYQQKKTNLKLQIKELQQQFQTLQFQQQQSIKSSGNQSPLDDRAKLLFEQRILELEQFYQKDKKQEKVRSLTTSKDRKQNHVMQILTQFLEEFIKQQESLRQLNCQINDMRNDQAKRNNTCFKKIVWVIIFINRTKKIHNSSFYQQYIYFKKLHIELPIINTFNQVLELISAQQQLIDTLQTAVEHKSSDGLQESDMQQLIDQELRQQLKSLQTELDNNNKKMMEYKQRSEQELEERDQIIQELEQQQNEQQLEQQIIEHLEEQNSRVKQIENEFNVLNELVNSFM